MGPYSTMLVHDMLVKNFNYEFSFSSTCFFNKSTEPSLCYYFTNGCIKKWWTYALPVSSSAKWTALATIWTLSAIFFFFTSNYCFTCTFLDIVMFLRKSKILTLICWCQPYFLFFFSSCGLHSCIIMSVLQCADLLCF